MVGKFCISSSNVVMPVFTAELFPTTMRNLGVGSSNVPAGVALMLVPYLWNLVTTFSYCITTVPILSHEEIWEAHYCYLSCYLPPLLSLLLARLLSTSCTKQPSSAFCSLTYSPVPTSSWVSPYCPSPPSLTLTSTSSAELLSYGTKHPPSWSQSLLMILVFGLLSSPVPAIQPPSHSPPS